MVQKYLADNDPQQQKLDEKANKNWTKASWWGGQRKKCRCHCIDSTLTLAQQATSNLRYSKRRKKSGKRILKCGTN
jgi:ribosomal protein S8E